MVQRFVTTEHPKTSLTETFLAIRSHYPHGEVLNEQTSHRLLATTEAHLPELVLVPIGIMPALDETEEQILALLITLLQRSRPAPNLVVLTPQIAPLIPLKHAIYAYGGGFVTINQPCAFAEIVNQVERALSGLIWLPPAVAKPNEFDPTWLSILSLKFESGLSDRAIAQQLNVTCRAVCHYWRRIQRALDVHDHPDKDLHIQIQHAARRAGFIH